MNDNCSNINQIIKSILSFFHNNDEINIIYIFGSALTDFFRNDSDVDVAIHSSKNYSALELFDWQEELANKLNRDVDLINIQKSNYIMQMQIILNGKRIYTKEDFQADVFENTTYSLYLDFIQMRKPLVLAIQKQKQIYG